MGVSTVCTGWGEGCGKFEVLCVSGGPERRSFGFAQDDNSVGDSARADAGPSTSLRMTIFVGDSARADAGPSTSLRMTILWGVGVKADAGPSTSLRMTAIF